MTRHRNNVEPDETGGRITSQVGPWAMVPVWVLKHLKAGDIAVYVALRSFADQDGAAYPRQKVIAERAGMSESATKRAIQRMRDKGLLTSTHRYREDGSISGCDYLLTDLEPVENHPVLSGGSGVGERGGSGVHATGVVAWVSEQEHTTEHPRLNTPSGGDSAPPQTPRRRDASASRAHSNLFDSSNPFDERGPAPTGASWYACCGKPLPATARSDRHTSEVGCIRAESTPNLA